MSQKQHRIPGLSGYNLLKTRKNIIQIITIRSTLLLLIILLKYIPNSTTSFIISPQRNILTIHKRHDNNINHHPTTTIPKNSLLLPPLFAGRGTATDYTWIEERFDIDITVKVPIQTKTSNILFKTSPQSIDLRLSTPSSSSSSSGSDDDYVLLSGTRQLRGRINMDGTFWSIADSSDAKHRLVTVHVEKIKPTLDELDVERDWGGVYPDDDDEVVHRDYAKEEELDVKEYARSVGVDLDNLDMSLVDKTMFSDMTRGTLEELRERRLVREVTEQGGREFLDGEGGVEEFDPFEGVGGGEGGIDEELEKRMVDVREGAAEVTTLVDDEDATTTETAVGNDDDDDDDETTTTPSKDPIDLLTVARLKEILRDQNLKVSGKKQELRDRLRDHIRSLMEKKKDEE